jgi:hypothetical protein
MSVFERYLTLWVFLCIVVGIAAGQWVPGVPPLAGWKWRRSTCRWGADLGDDHPDAGEGGFCRLA